MLRLLQQHLERVRAKMKYQADKNRSERSVQLGDMVFMKLQSYIQSSVALRAHHKLLFKFYGPYRILEKVGASTYRLELPPNNKIHPVFHVSQLKQALGVDCQGSSLVSQALIQWSGQPESLATWEDIEELRQRFPRAAAWRQDAFQGKESVSIADTEAMTQARSEDDAQATKRCRRPSTRYASKDWIFIKFVATCFLCLLTSGWDDPLPKFSLIRS
uniref:Uncharacterized protein n=1 Tax=Avena sativa TaxID=4498 RepID=A0ACD5Z751_AVESA